MVIFGIGKSEIGEYGTYEKKRGLYRY